MTTWFVDPEAGTNANASAGNGDSFATRRKYIGNVVAAALAPGDTIRVIGSLAPTSLGQNGTWTDGPAQANKSIVGSTNATPIVMNVTAHGYSTGDTVTIGGHVTNTKANGVWEIIVTDADHFSLTGSVGNGVGAGSGLVRKITNVRVQLTSAVTQNIALCGNQGTKGNWTPSANVTSTIITTDFREGGECVEIAVAAGFTTGLAAFFATGSLNLSSFRQVSFSIKQTVGTAIATGDITLRLCTDVAGVTAAHTCTVQGVVTIGNWANITFNTGGALNAAIQSVALYIATDSGAQTFRIDNIIAVKDATSADSLSLNSLIGKNTTDETWWGIQSINGTRVMLDGSASIFPSIPFGNVMQRGYSGTTATVTTQKREPMLLFGSSTFTSVADFGTAGNLIAIEGGWDRTAMTTQNLDTWLDGYHGKGTGLILLSTPFVSVNKMNFVRFSNGVDGGGSDDCVYTNITCNNNDTRGFSFTSAVNRLNASNITAVANNFSGFTCDFNSPLFQGGTFIQLDSQTQGGGIQFGSSGGNSATITTIKRACNNAGTGVTVTGHHHRIGPILATNGNGGFGVNIDGCENVFASIVANNNNNPGISFQSAPNDGNVINGGSTSGNNSVGVSFSLAGGNNYLRNFTISEGTEVSITQFYGGGAIFSENHDNTAGNHKIFMDGALISAQTSVRHTASGIAWQMAPTSTNRAAIYPVKLSLAKIAVNASALVTVKAWMRRDNTGLTMSLVCPGGQLNGVASDVVSSMAAVANTFEELTITFTPTEAGVIEIFAYAYGGSTFNGYVDDMTISQA